MGGGAGTGLSIFLSYRREDAADAAGRLYDALIARFGAGTVFIDINSIDPGADFAETVGGALASCDVLLALIGRHWLTAADARGTVRLEDPADLVRVEIQTALASNVRVIPVLVQGAEMPGADQLPDGLKALAGRNAVEMTAARWNYDLERLTAALRRGALDTRTAPPPVPFVPRVRALVALGAVLVVAGGVVTGVLLSDGPKADVAENRSAALGGIPFTIEYPAAWRVRVLGHAQADFELAGPGGDISYISIGTWTARQAEQQLSSEDEQVAQTSERHSGLVMTVFDWTDNGNASGLNAAQGHQRLYAFSYRGAAWDIDCGWGTAGPVTTAEATAGGNACVAAVDSVQPVTS